MPIYEADFLGKPEPIKKPRKKKEVKPEPVVEEKPKRKRQPKQEATPSSSSVASETPRIETEPEQVPAPKRKRVSKPKPQPSEQLLIETKEEKPNASEETIKTIATKKGLQKKASKKIIDGKPTDEPPGWFKAWCLDQKKRENDEKPKKEKVSKPVLKEEATIEAKEKWNDGLTKDRVKMEVDNHMGRLYNQIYGRRL